MGITFLELQTKVASWFYGRTDLSAVIPDACNIALHKLEQSFNFRGMLTHPTATIVAAGTGSYSVPSDYKELKAAWFVDGGGTRWPLTKDSIRHSLTVSNNDTSKVADIPSVIIHDPAAGKFILKPMPSATGSLDYYYYATSPDMAGDADTNHILSGSWEMLLYGSLSEIADMRNNLQDMQKWAAKRDDVATKVVQAEFREEFAGSYLSLGGSYNMEGMSRSRR